jgi:hypothetical protein
MRPDQDDLDDEIRGHMALSVKERIERGEDPEAARLAALREFGNVTLTRDSMGAVWRPRWLDMAEALWQDIRVALRSLRRAKGLAVTVAMTLALGIGANAAIFSVVRQAFMAHVFCHVGCRRLLFLGPSRKSPRGDQHPCSSRGCGARTSRGHVVLAVARPR